MFLVVFQSAQWIQLKGISGFICTVPSPPCSWATGCYARPMCDTYIHTHENNTKVHAHTKVPLRYNETGDTNKPWQQPNNTFSHVLHLLFSHIAPSLLPVVTPSMHQTPQLPHNRCLSCHFMRQCLCAVHWCGKSSASSSCLHGFRTLIGTSDEQR